MMCLTLAVTLLTILNCVSSLKLDVESSMLHARVGEPITFMCKADGPIEDCQFKWKNRWSAGPVIDFKNGADSPAGSSTDFANTYAYSGGGLQQGDCGIRMEVHRWSSSIVGCRARAAGGSWKYQTVVVRIDSHIGFPMTASPAQAVAKPGDSVRILCEAKDKELNDCFFSFSTILVRFNRGPNSRKLNNTQYYGAGLEAGQCGILIEHVSLDHNGWMSCSAKTSEEKSLEVLYVPLLVAVPPTSVNLRVDNNPVKNGELLKATCQVPSSRPPPNITWYLGADVLRRDQELDTVDGDDEWMWVDTENPFLQKIEKNLTSKDNGKELRCNVDHISLTGSMSASERISVSIPPRCAPLTSSSLYLFCVKGNDIIGCHESVLPGTIAMLKCKTGFVAPVPHPGFTNITCMDNGNWNKQLYECVIDCGRRNTNAGETLIYGAYQAKIGEFPWHVAVYEKDGPNTYVHICGGSLITTEMVLSAAHCFWDNQLGEKKNNTLYKISAGKYYRDLYTQEDIAPQTREVRSIIIHERYKGRDSNFAVDIAKIWLSSPVQITARVSTVCVDWEATRERFDLSDGINGTVAGWGFTATGEQSDVLEAVDLPYAPFARCYRDLPQLLRQLLTEDKFCAGYLNKSISVCGGDSGGGLVFFNQKLERYFIRGIVSISFRPPENKERCFAQLYTAFTLVSRYHNFLQIPLV